MKQIIKFLEMYVSQKKIQREYALDVFLDFLIDFFDYTHVINGFEKHVIETFKTNPILTAATIEWMKVTTEGIENEGWYDSLGHLYEQMYQSKNKASSLGQFYTPDALCEMMAKVLLKESPNVKVISDSACGSGRTLLAAYHKYRDGYFIGDDIDSMSVRMCALNLMIHGALGRVLCHDSLKDVVHFDWGFEINEVRSPFPSQFYSLRKISNPIQTKV